MIKNDAWIAEQIGLGTIILDPESKLGVTDLVKPNSLDTTLQSEALVELQPWEAPYWREIIRINLTWNSSAVWTLAEIMQQIPSPMKGSSGMLSLAQANLNLLAWRFRSVQVRDDTPWLSVTLPRDPEENALMIPQGHRALVASNERLCGVLTDVTADARLRSGAARRGWLLGANHAECGFGHDPNGHSLEDSAFSYDATWVPREGWIGVCYTYALTNLSRNALGLRAYDRLVQLLFHEAKKAVVPYHRLESSSYAEVSAGTPNRSVK